MTQLQPAWARLTTNILSPPVVFLLLADYVLYRDAAPAGQFVLWSGTYALFAIVLPGLYVEWEIHQGKITDIHMPKRTERLWPFLLGVVGTIISWTILLSTHAPRNMMLFATFTVTYMVMITIVTFFWKVSAHTSAIAGAAVIVANLSGLIGGLTLFPLILLVGAARVALKRHTIAQVTAGVLLGASVAAIIFAFNR